MMPSRTKKNSQKSKNEMEIKLPKKLVMKMRMMQRMAEAKVVSTSTVTRRLVTIGYGMESEGAEKKGYDIKTN